MSVMRGRFTVVNTDTGEELESGPRRRYGFRNGHINVGIAEAAALSDLDLSGLEWRVFWRVVSICTGDGWTPLVAADLAKQMNSSAPSISRALKSLTKAGVILRSEVKDGKNCRYRLNPAHFFKGSALDHHAALVETSAYPVGGRHLTAVA